MGTNSEGSVKYCRCTFFGHATPDREQRNYTATKDKEWGDQFGGIGQMLPLHVFLDMPRRIALGARPYRVDVGSRDVTWASPTLWISPATPTVAHPPPWT